MAYDLNKLREEYKKISEKSQKNEGSGSDNFIKISEGSNMVRILPARVDGEAFYTKTALHVVKQGGNLKYFHCIKAVSEEPCPLCDAYWTIWARIKAGETHLEPIVKGSNSIRAKPRFYMNVVNRKDDTVKIYSAPESVFSKISVNILGDDKLNIDSLGDVTDTATGRDFNIIAAKKDIFLEFDQSSFRPVSTPAGTPQKIAEYLDQRHDLNVLVKKEDYSELKLVADSLMATGASNEVVAPVAKPAPLTDAEFEAKINQGIK